MTFQESLHCGAIGESLIARWLNWRGWHVLPVYEVEAQSGKGPRLFAKDRQLIAPDMLVLKGDTVLWIEAKHKDAFSWHRNTQQWTTGIDLRHYVDYCEVNDSTQRDVWLLFLHRGGQAKDSPPDSPSGLFGQSLLALRCRESHRHSNWGNSGMVYWGKDSLIKLASLEDVVGLQGDGTPPSQTHSRYNNV